MQTLEDSGLRTVPQRGASASFRLSALWQGSPGRCAVGPRPRAADPQRVTKTGPGDRQGRDEFDVSSA